MKRYSKFAVVRLWAQKGGENMPKIKPEGDPGTKTVMVTAEPGLSREQIEEAAKALPEIKEEGPDYNVVEALREVTLNASITEAEEAEAKREETEMAEEKKTNNEAEITDEMKEVESTFSEKYLNAKMQIGITNEGKLFFITTVNTMAGAGLYDWVFDSDGDEIDDEDNPYWVGQRSPEDEEDDEEDFDDDDM
jgi:hypothetical protein